MIILKKYIEIVYRLIFISVCGLGIGFHLDFYDNQYNMHAFSFFTVQSNIFCLIVICILLIRHWSGSNTGSRFLIYIQGMSLSAIVCTFLIYHFAEGRIKYPLLTVGLSSLPPATLFAHYIVPPLYILDWILFQSKGVFQKKYIVEWLAFPLIYFASFLTRSNCNPLSAFYKSKKYPYFFLDYETLGVTNFLGYLFMILVIMLVVNLFIYLLDHWMGHFFPEKIDCKKSL